MFPPDQVEAFERLVDEVEGVPATGEDPICLGREKEISKFRGGSLGGKRRQERTFGTFTVAGRSPVSEPSL